MKKNQKKINTYKKALFVVVVILLSAFFVVRYMTYSLMVEKSVTFTDTSDITSKNQETNLSNNMETTSKYENETNNEIEDIASFIPKDWEILKQGDE